MRIDLTAAARILPLTALMLAACRGVPTNRGVRRSGGLLEPRREQAEIANLQQGRALTEPPH
jgi:hypothetical protein